LTSKNGKKAGVLAGAVLLILTLALMDDYRGPMAVETATGAPTGKIAGRQKGPYLIYRGENTEMTLLWQATKTFTDRLKWGVDPSYGSSRVETGEYGYDHQHAYTFKNLKPGTRYYYALNMAGEIFSDSFRAAPPDNAADLKFMVYGDTRSNPQAHAKVAQAMVAVFRSDPDFQTLAIHLGDLVARGGLETCWQDQFFNSKYADIQKLLSKVSYQACVGNHDRSRTKNRPGDDQFSLFKKYFPYPFIDHAYWSFDYGPAHFVMADQYDPGPFDFCPECSPGQGRVSKIQLAWIENDLAATHKPWKFVCFHEPGWSAGGGHENNADIQQSLQPLLRKYGVAMVFAGHNHYYARAVVNGVQHVTTGGGGAPLYIPNPKSLNVMTIGYGLHFCKVVIDGSRLTFTAVKPDGTIMDAFTIRK
jgi:predicted phosphodiesterase